jgi:ATP-binding cassette, subfamily B, bacterial MsbA
VRLGSACADDAPQPGGARAHVARHGEAFTGHRIVKAFGAEAARGGAVRRASRALPHEHEGHARALAALPPLMELLGGVASRRRSGTAAARSPSGELTTGEFTSFVAALFLMYGPVKKLSRVNANLQQAIAAAERIFEMLDTHTEVRERPARRAAAAPRGHRVPRRDVRYEDGDGRRLRDVSFTVRPGRWSRSSGGAARARRRSSTCCRGSTT